MKQLQSTIEGTWVEINRIELTAEQIAILKSDDSDTKINLIAQLKEQKESAASDEDTIVCNAKYAEIKPTLKETDLYELISFDIANDSGILNCRVNGEHEQIRF
tara:strand:+ start:168 stop:479 length:312 start_codon:yes stop_codon:yes gene_type:complete